MSLDERIEGARQSFADFDEKTTQHYLKGADLQDAEIEQLFDEFYAQYASALEEIEMLESEQDRKKLKGVDLLVLQKSESLKSLTDEARRTYFSYQSLLKKVDKYRAPIKHQIEEDMQRLEDYKNRFDSLKRTKSLLDSFISEFGLSDENEDEQTSKGRE